MNKAFGKTACEQGETNWERKHVHQHNILPKHKYNPNLIVHCPKSITTNTNEYHQPRQKREGCQPPSITLASRGSDQNSGGAELVASQLDQ